MKTPLPSLAGRHKSGKYLINPDRQEALFIHQWIEDHAYKAFEKDEYRLDKHGRPRNHLYEVQIPNQNYSMVMKMSFINPAYRLSRKLDLFLNRLYKDYNKIAYRNMRALFGCNLPIAEPIAFWTDKRSWFDRRSFLLYEKINSSVTVAEFYQNLSHSSNKESATTVKLINQKIIDTLKEIHRCNFRYGDPHLNNILLLQNDSKDMNPQVFFIDYDHCRKTRIKSPFIKQFFDIRDIAAIVPNADTQQLENFLNLYFGKATKWQITVANFWSKGGFNLRTRIAPVKKRKRHIKKTF